MSTRAWAVVATAVVMMGLTAFGQEQGPAGPAGLATVGSHTVVTQRRTLYVFPFKGLITNETGWRRVTKGLADAPPKPDFEKHAVALVVADLAGGAESWIESVKGEGSVLHVRLVRTEPEVQSLAPHIKAFFQVVPKRCTGVKLTHVTRLAGGGGMIQRTTGALETDGDRRLLPRLGPDLRLTVSMANGGPLPEGVMLRYEAVYPSKQGQALPGRKQVVEFPHDGLPFPRVRDGVRHVYAAYAPGLRSQRPLVIRKLPRKGPDGSPLPIKHAFVLEPLP